MLREYNRGKLYDARQIDDAVQHILDRLIFIRTAENREVEGEKLIALVRELKDRNRLNDLIPELNRRFRELDRVYDSQLFSPHYSEDLELGEASTLADIINGLYGSPANFTSYNFALIDADVLGRVYEQYLGYVLSEREELEAKKAKRKSQGIYYTPTFVVKYIVQQTLGRYLEENGYNPAHPVRVLDPACGSGSFLIEAFDVLDQYLTRERRQERGEYDIQDHARQLQILTENIYGVDKDEQAVEVAQLNLLLKALHLRDKLPKLENIRCGDSLISGAPKELEKFFGVNWKAKNPFNWDEQFKKVIADGGFDVIVGNPPNVRIQSLPKDGVAFFNDHYAAATGNYDIYVLFVERALQLLKPRGVYGMILPKKFFNSKYGAGLRKLIADARALWKLVDFGDTQVFGDATTYTCLLFLHKQPNVQFTYMRAGNWLKTQRSGASLVMPNDLPTDRIQGDSVTESPWNFSVGSQAPLFEKLSKLPIKLGNVADIFVGLQTSADSVFVLEISRERGRAYTAHSKALHRAVTLEKEICKPLLKGSEIHRYSSPTQKNVVIFPYRVSADGAVPLTENELAKESSNTFEYLRANKKRLLKRGDSTKSSWFLYVYPKNLTKFRLPKILTGVLAKKASFTLDPDGTYYFVGGGNAGGYGIVPKSNVIIDLRYLLGLLNSSLLDFYVKEVSMPFRGGYYSYARRFIEQVPIHRLNLDDAIEKQQHDRIVALVDEMLELQKEYAAATREKLPRADALKRRIDEVDAEIDRIVYRLYGLIEEEIKVVEGE